MPSPFPGMNPFFEQADHWQDFHTEFLTVLRRHLVAQVGPDYIIKLEKHVYIHESPPQPRRLLGRADLSVTRIETTTARQANLGVLEAPAMVFTPAVDVEIERIAFLEIRDRRGRDLVTVLELLSPSNKRPGSDRSQYMTERHELLRSTAHLVEIDLLRGWEPMPMDGRPDEDYSVLVSRAERRPMAGFWPIRLRDRLPLIPIPLRTTDPDRQVDLQEILHQAYDEAGYEKFIYDGTPEPPLSGTDLDWAVQFIPKFD